VTGVGGVGIVREKVWLQKSPEREGSGYFSSEYVTIFVHVIVQ
jgi:hypothetical protein